MAKSKIEWTDAVWNPVTGCDKVSQGCKNCYAGRLAETRLKHLPEYKDGFYGNVQLHPDRLQQPLHWKKPRMVFVNSMSDLFHPEVPFEFIDRVFTIMAMSEQHTFQILTKRPERMFEYSQYANKHGIKVSQVEIYDAGTHKLDEVIERRRKLPLPNVWLGTSAEDQDMYDERAFYLTRTPAVIKFLSLEPLLGDISLELLDWPVNWVIAGGESGPKARPMHPDWVCTIRDQCKDANVPFFFKQWGEWMPEIDLKHLINTKKHPRYFNPRPVQIIDGVMMHKIGKKLAGNLLDGKKHAQFPTIRQAASISQTG